MSKILILANNDIGLYKFRKELIVELLKENDVYISLPDGPYVQDLITLGCKFIDTEINRRGTNPIDDFKLLLKYRSIIGNVRPDTVLTYTIKPNIYGGIVCGLLKIPYIANVTGLGSAINNGKSLRTIILKLYKAGLHNAKKIFFQNNYNMNYFIENKVIHSNKTELIPGSGINLDTYQYLDYPTTDTEINLVYIGRLMKEKGILELFEAAKYFKGSSKSINFHLIGFLDDSDIEVELNELIDKNIIIFHGQQSDVRPFVEQAHAIIHPSYHEGLSNVLLEAAATGRPILASDIPGCRETFDEKVTGLGFKSKSSKSLINTIMGFIKLPYEVKKKMGLNGRDKIEKEFDRQIVVDAYIKEIGNENHKKTEFKGAEK